MKKENIRRAVQIEQEIKKLEGLLPYIDNCLNKKEGGFHEIRIILSSTGYETKDIQSFVPQLIPVIAIIAKENIKKKIKELETELETL